MNHQGLIVISGATATGKSGLGLKLAQQLNTIIVSADSRQVYRELDIGTAKPSLPDQHIVPHYLIDICSPTETLTVADYQQQAQTLINDVSPPKIPLLVGGTGLYIKSIVKGMKIPRVAPHKDLRQQLQALGQPHCYQLFSQIDPLSTSKIHPNDQVRTLRALEVYYVTGKPISEQQGENPPPYPILHIGLHCEPDLLRQRIERRTQQMVKQGLVEEVANLGNKYGWELPLLKTLGYAEMRQYLRGEITLKQAIDLTILHTSQFAKRQRTWFRAYSEIEWFDANSSHLWLEVWQRVQKYCDRSLSFPVN
ncbi:MAG: tRNA (adenosine(37)-N6)-dimethylallyltransferase MiaA [Microcystaceae cyanobacterium]